jgi:hypothetical protein
MTKANAITGPSNPAAGDYYICCGTTLEGVLSHLTHSHNWDGKRSVFLALCDPRKQKMNGASD